MNEIKPEELTDGKELYRAKDTYGDEWVIYHYPNKEHCQFAVKFDKYDTETYYKDFVAAREFFLYVTKQKGQLYSTQMVSHLPTLNTKIVGINN